MARRRRISPRQTPNRRLSSRTGIPASGTRRGSRRPPIPFITAPVANRRRLSNRRRSSLKRSGEPVGSPRWSSPDTWLAGPPQRGCGGALDGLGGAARIGRSMTVGCAVRTITGVFGVTSGVRTISGVNLGVGVGVGVLTIGTRMIGVRRTGPLSAGSGVGARRQLRQRRQPRQTRQRRGRRRRPEDRRRQRRRRHGRARRDAGGPARRDGINPSGQGVGPTGRRNTPQISLPLIHCWVSPLGHDGGGGGRQDHRPLRQFGCPLGHGTGGGGLPPQT